MRSNVFAVLVLSALLGPCLASAEGTSGNNLSSNEQPLTSRSEVARIVRSTTTAFAKAVKANDLKSFYANTAPEFQAKISFAEFERSYGGEFVKDGADLTAVENIEPQLSAEPSTTPSGRLHVNGLFLLTNGQVNFTYEYFHRSSGWQLAGMHIVLDMRDHDFEAIVAELRKKAKGGDADAQFNLGLRLRDGTGTPRNDVEAVYWYRKAAEQGNTNAQLTLGYMLATGQGVTKNEAEGVAWYRKAAEHGDAHAQRYLGVMLASGTGVAQDRTEAALWFRKAAEQGEVVAQDLYAGMLEEGISMPKNETAALGWYRKAAAQGDPDARKHVNKLEHGGVSDKK
jgi:hypothetical protein